ncbi:unnamed protein product [Schistosoma curassoni]|uniref:Uncharacterized protein n=1 Tax=Schistosoma curassoni TaxID=6186 RepID=A0A183KVU9_9TREM|nr:unnamed protein product [Schistosoma curassoni]
MLSDHIWNSSVNPNSPPSSSLSFLSDNSYRNITSSSVVKSMSSLQSDINHRHHHHPHAAVFLLITPKLNDNYQTNLELVFSNNKSSCRTNPHTRNIRGYQFSGEGIKLVNKAGLSILLCKAFLFGIRVLNVFERLNDPSNGSG